MLRPTILLLCIILWPLAATADVRHHLAAAGWQWSQSASSVSVIDGDTLRLNNGERVRLSGVYAPAPNLESATDYIHKRTQPFVQAWLHNQAIELWVKPHHQRDRYGRWLAMVVRSDGAWLQHDLIDAGLSLVYVFPSSTWLSSKPNRADETILRLLLTAEIRAQQNKTGLWQDTFQHMPLTTHQSWRRQYAVARATPQSWKKYGNTIYVNFAKFWKHDLTLEIDARKNGQWFVDAPPSSLPQLLARGWSDEKNGPRLNIQHWAQLACIDAQSVIQLNLQMCVSPH